MTALFQKYPLSYEAKFQVVPFDKIHEVCLNFNIYDAKSFKLTSLPYFKEKNFPNMLFWPKFANKFPLKHKISKYLIEKITPKYKFNLTVLK